MSRPTKISTAEKRQQGVFIQSLYEAYQAKMGGTRKYNQNDLGRDIGMLVDATGETIYPASLISQWFSGKTAIPDHAWLALSDFFEFDPFVLRHDLESLKDKLEASYVKWRGPARTGLTSDHGRLLEMYMKADRRGKESILRVAEIEAEQSDK